jgi:hypothetical protein
MFSVPDIEIENAYMNCGKREKVNDFLCTCKETGLVCSYCIANKKCPSLLKLFEKVRKINNEKEN